MLKTIFALCFILANFAVAHGEDKPGPHGGEIRRSGAFHTELKVSGQEIWVYLLDLKFEKPRTDKSSVEIEAVFSPAGTKPVKLDCRPAKATEPPRFACIHDHYEPSRGQTLRVRAKRGAEVGPEVSYVLPILSTRVVK